MKWRNPVAEKNRLYQNHLYSRAPSRIGIPVQAASNQCQSIRPLGCRATPFDRPVLRIKPLLLVVYYTNMPCQCGYPDGMSPRGRMVFPRAPPPPSGKPSSLWETLHQDTHTGMAYLYNSQSGQKETVNNNDIFVAKTKLLRYLRRKAPLQIFCKTMFHFQVIAKSIQDPDNNALWNYVNMERNVPIQTRGRPQQLSALAYLMLTMSPSSTKSWFQWHLKSYPCICESPRVTWVQCRHLIPALNAWASGHNTRPHDRLPPSYLVMNGWMTSQLNIALFHMLRGSSMSVAYSF